MTAPSAHRDSTLLHDELDEVARAYRHVREEHRRARRGGHSRRHLGIRLERLGARFEHLLTEAGLDEPERRRWRDRLRHGAAEPEKPLASAPLLFRGRSEAGAELRLVARHDGALDALVDGSTTERLESADELAATTPGLIFRLDGVAFRETFAASPTARAALRESLESGATPEAPYIGELLADGILGRDLAVTARGRRALGLDATPARRVGTPPLNLSITLRGPLPPRARTELEAMAARVAAIAPRRPVRARFSLVHEEDRALERPVIAKAQLDLSARSVRAHVAASSAAEAIDLLEARLRRNLVDLGDRIVAGRKEGRPVQAGRWRHGDLAVARPAFLERSPDERQLVRRKAYTATPLTAEEAARELALLDHDFHLFTDASSGDAAVVYMRADGVPGLKRAAGDGGWAEPFPIDPEPAPQLSVEQSIEWLNTTQKTFLFFLEGDDRRGAVLYRRYDGNYGLLTLRSSA